MCFFTQWWGLFLKEWVNPVDQITYGESRTVLEVGIFLYKPLNQVLLMSCRHSTLYILNSEKSEFSRVGDFLNHKKHRVLCVSVVCVPVSNKSILAVKYIGVIAICHQEQTLCSAALVISRRPMLHKSKHFLRGCFLNSTLICYFLNRRIV